MGWGGPSGSPGWGLTPWGGGGTLLRLLGAEAVRENVVRLTFNQPVRFTGVLDPNDASDASRYTIAAIEGTVGLDGLPVRPVNVAHAALALFEGAGGMSIDVTTDRAFSPFPTVYRVIVSQLVGLQGQLLDVDFGSTTFPGLYRGIPRPSLDQSVGRRDFANPDDLAATLDPLPEPLHTELGVFAVDETGDYARDEGRTSYRKRLMRRANTKPGSFLHLQDYGLGLPYEVKQLARTATQQRLAEEAERQFLEEPETLRASVTFEQDTRAVGLYVMKVRCQTKTGEVENIDFQFNPTTGG